MESMLISLSKKLFPVNVDCQCCIPHTLQKILSGNTLIHYSAFVYCIS